MTAVARRAVVTAATAAAAELAAAVAELAAAVAERAAAAAPAERAAAMAVPAAAAAVAKAAEEEVATAVVAMVVAAAEVRGCRARSLTCKYLAWIRARLDKSQWCCTGRHSTCGSGGPGSGRTFHICVTVDECIARKTVFAVSCALFLGGASHANHARLQTRELLVGAWVQPSIAAKVARATGRLTLRIGCGSVRARWWWR